MRSLSKRSAQITIFDLRLFFQVFDRVLDCDFVDIDDNLIFDLHLLDFLAYFVGGRFFFFQKITLLQIDIVFSSGWWSLVLRLMSAITLLEIVSCSFYGSAVRCE